MGGSSKPGPGTWRSGLNVTPEQFRTFRFQATGTGTGTGTTTGRFDPQETGAGAIGSSGGWSQDSPSNFRAEQGVHDLVRVFDGRARAHWFPWKVEDAHVGPLPCLNGDPFCWNAWCVRAFRFTGGGPRTLSVPWVGA